MDYKETIQLPKTDFPMKADLAKREPQFLDRWKKEGIYQKILQAREGGKTFVLHDGPPFANGDAHMGHALNKTLKDIVLKSHNMMGFYAPYIPGWDCHGLPIEHKVMKELKPDQQIPVVIRQHCEAYARKYINLQRDQFQRLGVFADWANPYLTLNAPYEADILRVFATLVERGLVYQGLRPVYWSTGCQTALAEAEIEYEQKVDPAAYVKFRITETSAVKLGLPSGTSLLIWTTTPWTLPANLAVAVAADLEYVLTKSADQALLVAKSLHDKIPHLEGWEISKSFKGSELVGTHYQHPFLTTRRGNVYTGDFVTAEAGTGFVHIAPGHGMDDYKLGQQHGLEPLSPVDDRGCLTAECGVPSLVGIYVFKANEKILEILKTNSSLWHTEDYPHDYPHCWRSKTPIVFRSVKQWFIKVDAFREAALKEIEQVQWIPSWGINRIKGAVATRSDWCISRQRTWGVPIPAFYQEDGTPILDAEIIRKVAKIVETSGTNHWFEVDSATLTAELGLPAGLKKGTDTLDVWIDSGSSHAAVVSRRQEFPADLYLEGSDQHRGWFQSSLLLSVATNGKAPFKQVLTNGFVVDLDGKKLSKSSGARGMMDYINEYGADILRLWVSSEDYRNDVPFSKEIFTRVADSYRQIRNSIRILLGNLHGFDPAKQSVNDQDLTEVDRYLGTRLDELIRAVQKSYEEYEFHQVYHVLNRFCAVELSAFYIDVLKDRMYCDPPGSIKRRSSQTMMHRVLDALIKLSAPILPFTAEESWSMLQHSDSVHLQLFPSPTGYQNVSLDRWTKLLALRGAVNEAMEKARQEKLIGKSLEAAVEISSPDFDEEDLELVKELSMVSQLRLSKSPQLEVKVARATGNKCVRCWKYEPSLGSDPKHPELCDRCTQAVTSILEKKSDEPPYPYNQFV